MTINDPRPPPEANLTGQIDPLNRDQSRPPSQPLWAPSMPTSSLGRQRIPTHLPRNTNLSAPPPHGPKSQLSIVAISAGNPNRPPNQSHPSQSRYHMPAAGESFRSPRFLYPR
ncbi:hypothetical protein HZ326_19960 [Fusarium oxysporum f. sp. albedinis]|nr:hypothetical protein HZ326_19960 [Fusarium oxysporum f. sp. albedinis]